MIDKTFFDNVSRETMDDFYNFKSLLMKWNVEINLVSSSTIVDFMTRHVLDSVQLINYFHSMKGKLLDIGTGGGFPGIPLAIYAKNVYPKIKFNFMDSNSKKCLFIEEVCRHLNIEANIICGSIETIPSVDSDIIVSRALAPLPELLKYSKMHRKINGKCLFLKGKNYKFELEAAKKHWYLCYKIYQSVSHSDGKIIEINQHSLKNKREV